MRPLGVFQKERPEGLPKRIGCLCDSLRDSFNIRHLHRLGRIATQQNDPQPNEPDDLSDAKESCEVVQRRDDRDDAHRADQHAEDVQSLGKSARPQRGETDQQRQ